METGAVSEKIRRGRHTTRHAELIHIGDGTYVMDTPGFSSLYLSDMGEEELKDCFAEFRQYEGQCRFLGCSHRKEPGCAVKDAVENGRINPVRYENYRLLYEELKHAKKW